MEKVQNEADTHTAHLEEDRGICLHIPPCQDSPPQKMNCGSEG